MIYNKIIAAEIESIKNSILEIEAQIKEPKKNETHDHLIWQLYEDLPETEEVLIS